MDQDRVHRDALYAEVWETPMLTLAPKYGVSAVFLSKVCARLKIPCPPRGYWARKRSGQKPKIPPLPKFKSGDPAEWKKGDELVRSEGSELVEAIPRTAKARHAMIMGSLASFTSGRVSDDGYLRPTKRNLPDIVTTEPTLNRAAAMLTKLATRFREANHRIAVACGESGFTRKALDNEDGRLRRSIYQTWSPGKPTLVFIGATAIGLTIYEQTVEKEVVYIDGKYVPVREARKLKPGLWDRRTKTFYRTSSQTMASKHLCLRAYSPYFRVEWSHTWHEDKVSLARQVDEIVMALVERAEILEPQVAEADRQVAEEIRVWEVERAIARRKYERSLVQDARDDSLRNLLRVIEKWSADRRFSEFFDDITARSASMSEEARRELNSKIMEAKSLIASADVVDVLMAWASPPPLPSDPEDE